MTCRIAEELGSLVVILPPAETKEEFDTKSRAIFSNLSFFSNNLLVVDFEKRELYEKESWDAVQTLSDRKFDDDYWRILPTGMFCVKENTLPEYPGLEGKKNVLVIPQKLLTDGRCRLSAEDQSLPLFVFNFLKGRNENLVLGQHFDKKTNLEVIKNLSKEFNMYIPGATENTHVFGIRGVQHKEYYNMYASLSASVGIAGTHTWILLTTFPHIPQIILFKRTGVENWEAIGKAYQSQGYPIHCLGYDKDTDLQEFSKLIEETYNQLGI